MSYSPPSSAKPFKLNIPDQEVADWRNLLELSKLAPDTWEGRQEDRRYGVPRQWLSNTRDYWLNKFDWREQERHINTFPNYKIQIEDIDVHFVALFSEKKNAIPVILMHGWPGSFIEFLPICRVIRDQYSPAELPYHIVIPSLPGYTLSSGPPVDKDWTMEDTARIMNQLMIDLGFDKYIAQGGDIGSFQARLMSQNYDACVAIHLNMFSTLEEWPENEFLSSLEMRTRDWGLHWRSNSTAYAQKHATRPSTIGLVLSASPLALLTWIAEGFLEWTDEDLPLDTILTNITLYWFTKSFARSIYPYRQLFGTSPIKFEYLKKPTGISLFPHEMLIGTKSMLEKEADIVFHRTNEHGGHFAALEKPKELWSDVEAFIKTEGVWNAESTNKL